MATGHRSCVTGRRTERHSSRTPPRSSGARTRCPTLSPSALLSSARSGLPHTSATARRELSITCEQGLTHRRPPRSMRRHRPKPSIARRLGRTHEHSARKTQPRRTRTSRDQACEVVQEVAPIVMPPRRSTVFDEIEAEATSDALGDTRAARCQTSRRHRSHRSGDDTTRRTDARNRR